MGCSSSTNPASRPWWFSETKWRRKSSTLTLTTPVSGSLMSTRPPRTPYTTTKWFWRQCTMAGKGACSRKCSADTLAARVRKPMLSAA